MGLCSFYAVFCLIFASRLEVHCGNASHSNSDKNKFHLVTVNFERIAEPFVIVLWVFAVCIAITGYHYLGRFSQIVPESCLLIILGLPIGAIYKYASVVNYFEFSPDLFFLLLLPPIVLNAAYFVNTRSFFENILPIILHAVLGTLFNTFATGTVLKLISPWFGLGHLSFSHFFLFGALISAVDPVAVLAVFDELGVHQLLFIIVFGESLLNDAVTIVLYNMFESFIKMNIITHREILLGIASFFIVSVGGIVIGLFFGLLTGFITRFTSKHKIMEPIIIMVVPYISYMCAELFHFSGIMSIMFCAVSMKPYVETNITKKSRDAVRWALKAISTTTEAIIFVFFGVSLFTVKLEWNTGLTLITLLSISVFRILSILVITLITNRTKPREKVSWVEQFIMMYGGLRGAVSISLALILDESEDYKNIFVTTAFFIVLFTIFVQGITMKPLVKFFKIKLEKKDAYTMLEEMNIELIDHFTIGMEAINGVKYFGYYRRILKKVITFLKKYLTNSNKKRNTILAAHKEHLYKHAIKLVKKNPSVILNHMSSFDIHENVKSYGSSIQDHPELDPKVHKHNVNKLNVRKLFDNYVTKSARKPVGIGSIFRSNTFDSFDRDDEIGILQHNAKRKILNVYYNEAPEIKRKHIMAKRETFKPHFEGDEIELQVDIPKATPVESSHIASNVTVISEVDESQGIQPMTFAELSANVENPEVDNKHAKQKK